MALCSVPFPVLLLSYKLYFYMLYVHQHRLMKLLLYILCLLHQREEMGESLAINVCSLFLHMEAVLISTWRAPFSCKEEGLLGLLLTHSFSFYLSGIALVFLHFWRVTSLPVGFWIVSVFSFSTLYILFLDLHWGYIWLAHHKLKILTLNCITHTFPLFSSGFINVISVFKFTDSFSADSKLLLSPFSVFRFCYCAPSTSEFPFSLFSSLSRFLTLH